MSCSSPPPPATLSADPTAFLRAQFLAHATATYGAAIAAFRLLREYSDMRLPHEWYPNARKLKVRDPAAAVGAHARAIPRCHALTALRAHDRA